MNYWAIFTISLLMISSPALSQETQDDSQTQDATQRTEATGSQENKAASPPAEVNTKCACMKKCMASTKVDLSDISERVNKKFDEDPLFKVFSAFFEDDDTPKKTEILPNTLSACILDDPDANIIQVRKCLETASSEIKSTGENSKRIMNETIDIVSGALVSAADNVLNEINKCQPECGVSDSDVCSKDSFVSFDITGEPDVSEIANNAAVSIGRVDQKVRGTMKNLEQAPPSQDGSGVSQVTQTAPGQQEGPSGN